MPTDLLTRFREEALRLGVAERKQRQSERLEKLRADAAAVAVSALAAATPIFSKLKRQLEQLLEDVRAAAEEQRGATEAHIAGVLALADSAARIWETTWEEAFSDRALDRATATAMLRWVLEDAGQLLRDALLWARAFGNMLERPLARLDELEVRAAEFPLWAQECLARWEILDRPRKLLDRERLARSRAAYEQGECEDVADIMARVERGGPLVRE
jgi:hypothetical protein